MTRLAVANRSAATSAKVHPSVLLSICEAFNRRSSGCDRIGGTLLGSKDGNVIDIRNCYAVPFSEVGDQVSMDVLHHQTLYSLNRKVNPKDVIVGWFSSGYAASTDSSEPSSSNEWISGTDNLINDFYAKNRDSGSIVPPVFLKVDTGFSNGELGIKAYVSKSMSLGSLQLGTEFAEIELQTQTTNLQKISSDVLSMANGSAGAPGVGSLDNLQTAVNYLTRSLETAQRYCEDVAAGKQEGSAAVGRFLADAVSSMPHLSPAALDQAAAEDSQDMLLLLYLSQLVQAHLALADQLGTSSLPLL